ncbi:MAG TPA: peptidoglycan DD-metalloendopeptidase family protein [Blastocatellia bacterium]|nr:peptidoglycan DD-metalloendopeptidase family protein [Blastocatellia bacterium]
MTKAGVWRSFVSAILALSTSSLAAFAQSPAAQSPKEPPAQPQSAIQVVTDEKPLAPKPLSPAQPAAQPQKPAAPQPQEDPQPVITPPAPLIVKKTANAILIPLEGVSEKRADSDAKFEERPAVSSSVSVGSVYGYRRDPFTRRARFHSGVDIKARWGDAVGASQAGTVQFAGWYHGYGNLIIVDHGGGVATHYAHLSSFDVEVGTHVERGAIIGRAGSTGRATSAHLHYEVRIDGAAMNPFQTLALDPSSEYFKQSRPQVDAGRADSVAAPSSASREH